MRRTATLMFDLIRKPALVALLGLFVARSEATAADGAGANGGAARKPNVVVILSDDQGWGDLSLNGNTNLSTPNIDSLARDGAQFERFYVSPVCSPTRAEFLTGRYHVRGGVFSTSTGGERLDLDERTIAQAFKSAGYATAAYGKWHNGMQYPYHPNARGFDDYYGFCSGHWGDYFSPPLEHNGKPVKGDGFIIDDFTNHGLKFIDEHRDSPFFLYLPFNTPHSPMQVPDEYYDRFRDKELALRAEVRDGQAAGGGGQGAGQGKKKQAAGGGAGAKAGEGPKTTEDLNFTRAALAMCENIDWNVGRLLKKLDETGLAENTIVLYFCDNGPNGPRWNGGMKGRKGSTDEGGVRSPLLLRWPKTVKPGTVVKPISGAIDLLPTLTELCGVASPAGGKPLDGVSLAPVLRGDTTEMPARKYFSHWSGNVSVRTQQYRLDAAGQLFDMVADPGQHKNVAAEHPEVASELTQAVDQWRREVLSELNPQEERPYTVGYKEFPITTLPARDGIPHGQIQRSAKAPNCSYFTNWTSTDDTITWDVEVATAGRYEAVVYYTCAERDLGCVVQLELGEGRVSTKVTKVNDPPALGLEHDRADRGSESFVKDFQPLTLGEVTLAKGRGPLTLRALEKPGPGVIEVRAVQLTLLP
jgi:arylsulfatase A-like enzyme